MAFIPTAPATSEPRPIVAWTHGTVGEGDACAPSRQKDPTSQLTQFLPSMIQLGWALVATDYTGSRHTRSPGVPTQRSRSSRHGEQRASIATNSTRKCGSRYTVLGHSQGGHTALWTGHLSEKFAPELELLGVAAAAPAAELTQILGKQWDTVSELGDWRRGLAIVAASVPQFAHHRNTDPLWSKKLRSARTRTALKTPPLKLKSDLTPLMNNSFPRIHQKIRLGLPLSMSRLPRRSQPTCLCYLFKGLPTKLSFLSQMPTYKRPGVRPARRSAHCGLVGSDT